MKKFFTLFTVLAFAATSFAQTPRMVLLEHFTSASCPPCAIYNPQVEALLGVNESTSLSIKYQVNWPIPNGDPMNNHNKLDVQSRVNYYGVSSVPSAVLAAKAPEHPASAMVQDSIDKEAAKTSPFEVNVTHTLSEDFKNIDVKMEITATGDYSATGNLVAHIAVIEKHISFVSAPGSNGETDFYNVMKKMLPTPNGTALSKDWMTGETRTIEASWPLRNVYNLDQLDVIAFIQDNGNQEIMQAADSETSIINSNDALALTATPIEDFNSPGTVCGKEIAPTITIINGGSEQLTSLDITFKINSGATHTYNWTGSLGYLQTEEVQMPSVPFPGLEFNQMDVTTSNPNGVMDENPDNDVLNHFFPAAPETTVESVIEVTPIGAPQFLTWKLYDSNNNEVASGGPYVNANVPVKENVTLMTDECYNLEANNGVAAFNGRVALKNDAGEIKGRININAAGITSMAFGTFSLSSIESVLNTNSLSVYPNPTANETTVEFEMKSQSRVDFVLMNAIGQRIWSKSTDLNSGLQQENIDVSAFANGLYFLQLKTEQGMVTKQLLIER